MIGNSLRARLCNSDGELIAEGPCWLDEAAGKATLEPEREPGVLQKERGTLILDMEDGHRYTVSDRAMIVQMGPPNRRRMFRLRLIDSGDRADVHNAQDANAAGDAGDGSPAPSIRQTPAAR